MTSHAEIEQAAFRLFLDRGFDATTLEDIAREVGVSRRTIWRYFRSKSDIPWGRFDRTLESFRGLLADSPSDLSLFDAIGRAVVDFNRFPEDASPPHSERMRLILGTPTLQAHSVLRYREWRDVIATYAAERLGVSPGELVPRMLGHISLALALTAYEAWLDAPSASLPRLIEESLSALKSSVEGQVDRAGVLEGRTH